MSVNYSANQYEQAFNTKRMQSWEDPVPVSRRPARREGFTQFVATDGGHLLPGVQRTRSSPWGSFVGTWDMPHKLPGNNILNRTARSERAALRFETEKEQAAEVLSGELKQRKAYDPVMKDVFPRKEDNKLQAVPQSSQRCPSVPPADTQGGTYLRASPEMADLTQPENAHYQQLHESQLPKPGTPGNAVRDESRTHMSPSCQDACHGEKSRTPVNWPVAKSPQPFQAPRERINSPANLQSSLLPEAIDVPGERISSPINWPVAKSPQPPTK